MKVSLTQWLDAGTKFCRWYCVRSGRKYVGAKQVVRGDLLRNGLSGVTERVRPSRQGSEGTVGGTTMGDSEQPCSCTTTWSSTSVRAYLCLSSVTAAGSPSFRAEWLEAEWPPQEVRHLQDRAVRQARACHEMSRPSGPDRAVWQTSVCADISGPKRLYRGIR